MNYQEVLERNTQEVEEFYKNSPRRFNCWGATLFLIESTKRLEWVEREDMEDFLEYECEEISEEQCPGDILALYFFGELIHTAIVSPNGLFLHKCGGLEFEEVPKSVVLRKYHSDEERFFRYNSIPF